jgi:iron-siderophore transport system ATP-binding protein
MRDGRVVASGSPREVVDADLVRALYDVDADILRAPDDGTPVVVPRLAEAPSAVPSASG